MLRLAHTMHVRLHHKRLQITLRYLSLWRLALLRKRITFLLHKKDRDAYLKRLAFKRCARRAFPFFASLRSALRSDAKSDEVPFA